MDAQSKTMSRMRAIRPGYRGGPARSTIGFEAGGWDGEGELALRLADYAYVLEIGTVALEGPAEELHENDHVRRAYLGG